MIKKKSLQYLLILLLLHPIISCQKAGKLEVLHQVTGPIKTNCYLLYEVNSGEAALFDVGGDISTLLKVVKEKNLDLKYIFATHLHPDHVEGIPPIKKQFPQAKLCLSQEEYQEIPNYMKIEEILPAKKWEALKKAAEEDPAILKMMNFDLNMLGKPDIFLSDNQILKLGGIEIKCLLSPGHSRGSICFHIGSLLFSGDVLFYRRVGSTQFPGAGGPEAIIKSVRRLYSLLPDDTKVFPSHGKLTDIGSEKKENKEVSADKVNVQN
jgi:glyoxylase-like metal-dependent hydrolase (beta-lactamase superfamily II)